MYQTDALTNWATGLYVSADGETWTPTGVIPPASETGLAAITTHPHNDMFFIFIAREFQRAGKSPITALHRLTDFRQALGLEPRRPQSLTPLTRPVYSKPVIDKTFFGLGFRDRPRIPFPSCSYSSFYLKWLPGELNPDVWIFSPVPWPRRRDSHNLLTGALPLG